MDDIINYSWFSVPLVPKKPFIFFCCYRLYIYIYIKHIHGLYSTTNAGGPKSKPMSRSALSGVMGVMNSQINKRNQPTSSLSEILLQSCRNAGQLVSPINRLYRPNNAPHPQRPIPSYKSKVQAHFKITIFIPHPLLGFSCSFIFLVLFFCGSIPIPKAFKLTVTEFIN